jgi:hypothetical protein
MPKFVVDAVGEFPLDPDTLKLREMIDLERATGEKIDAILASFNGWDNPRGIRGGLGVAAFLWLSMKRAGHIVEYARMVDEVDVSALRIEWSDTEAVPDPQEKPPAPRKGRGGGSARKTAAASPAK